MSKHELQYRNACVACNKWFMSARDDAQYCSVKCRVRAHRAKKSGTPIVPQKASPAAPPPAPSQSAASSPAAPPLDTLPERPKLPPDWDPQKTEYQHRIDVRIKGVTHRAYPVYDQVGFKKWSTGEYLFATWDKKLIKVSPDDERLNPFRDRLDDWGKRPDPEPYTLTPAQIARAREAEFTDGKTRTIYPFLVNGKVFLSKEGKELWLWMNGEYAVGVKLDPQHPPAHPDKPASHPDKPAPRQAPKKRLFGLW